MTTTEHLISCLGEEGAEIAQDCSKINRFGIDDRYPQGGDSNQEKLVNELNDLLGVAQILVRMEVIPSDWQSESKQSSKRAKVLNYMQYARERGTITD